jgi:chromosome segregation ATPase
MEQGPDVASLSAWWPALVGGMGLALPYILKNAYAKDKVYGKDKEKPMTENERDGLVISLIVTTLGRELQKKSEDAHDLRIDNAAAHELRRNTEKALADSQKQISALNNANAELQHHFQVVKAERDDARIAIQALQAQIESLSSRKTNKRR